ncbi:hypothetical protein [Microbacterium elymi]|uniref:Uncharacterized protein n=1 Tax=Microbacterium elymi TaxID=2909587 RepID=A0ABY5NKT7_9MICO|nr:MULTISPECIES: hypothetical protein [Microbacterium]UUT35793.1 hypothetical protein L2X98_21600 [Microbacterium elymi]
MTTTAIIVGGAGAAAITADAADTAAARGVGGDVPTLAFEHAGV